MAAARYLLRPESPLSITNNLVDVDIPALEAVLGVHLQAQQRQSNHGNNSSNNSVGSGGGNSFLQDVTPALTSVSTFFTSTIQKLESNNSNAKIPVGPASAGSSINASNGIDVAVSAAGAKVGSKANTTATNINEESSSASTTASASASAGVTQAKELLSVFGKRISIFGNNSLESWKKSGWAGVGEVVEVEMDRIMGPLFLVLVLQLLSRLRLLQQQVVEMALWRKLL